MTNHLESLVVLVLEPLCQEFLDTNVVLNKSSKRIKFQEKLTKSQFNSLLVIL